MASFEEEQERLRQAQQQMTAGGGTTGALPPNSVPPAPGVSANVGGAPLPQAGANESQVGGAASQAQTTGIGDENPNTRPEFDLMKDRDKPDKHFINMAQKNPQAMDEALTEASDSFEKERTSGARASDADREELATTLENNGANPEGFKKMKSDMIKGLNRAIEDGEMSADEGKKYKLHWRNVFQKIKRDEMGLFLMDFGLRTMIAGETMGDVGAIGAGGAGALQGLQGRRQLARQQTLEVEQQGHDMAIDQMNAESRAAQNTLSAEGGYMTYVPGKGWERITETDPETGEKKPVIPSSLAGKPPVDKWKIDWYKKHMGLTEAEAGRRVLGGVTPEQAMQDAQSAWARFENNTSGATITINGRSYRKRDLPAGAKDEFIEEFMDSFGMSARDAAGGALTGGGSGRPEGMDDYIN